MALSTFAGGRLWGARYGAGPARVLALHGWARGHSDFDPVLDGMDAIALDLPGFGVSPEPPSSWSTQEYAGYVSKVFAEMAEGPLVVLGHSFGGRVGVWLARMAPPTGAGVAPGRNHVAALVLTGAPLAPFPGSKVSRPAAGYRLGRAMRRAHLISEARMEDLRRRYGSEDYRRASPLMRGVLVKSVAETASAAYTNPLQEWRGHGGRLALVWGERDDVASLEGTMAACRVPPEEVRVVHGAGHILTPALSAELRAVVRRVAGFAEAMPSAGEGAPS
ncbi:MAG TPA: alpha/beta fold hydrolase [Acidimicrobiales bacterium]|nr:alpha/beta fold hydrolase [Acidimicrobiales bacterium]